MTAFQNVAYPLQSRRMKKKEIAERVTRVFELVGIPELQRQYPGQMSGGQQQRVALARALAGDADLILFDEPLSNVDAKVREQLRFELLSMQRELGFAAVYVTHDQAEAMELAHRVAVMRRGQVAQAGPPQEIYLEPASRYVADFVGSSNELFGTVRSSVDGVAVVETELGAVTGVPGAEIAAGAHVVALCRPERTRLAVDEPSSPNRWRGEVRAGAFLGASLEHVVRVGDHTFRLWSVDTRLLDTGSEVWLYVEPEHVRVLPA
jgi:iron(III) transport system ATP-binding protein